MRWKKGPEKATMGSYKSSNHPWDFHLDPPPCREQKWTALSAGNSPAVNASI